MKKLLYEHLFKLSPMSLSKLQLQKLSESDYISKVSFDD